MSTVGSTSNDAHDLAGLFSSFLRNWPAIVLVAVAVAGVAFILASLATPHYRAESIVSIMQMPLKGQAQTKAGAGSLDREALETQIGILNSTDLLKGVIAQLETSDPAKLAEFDDAAAPSLFESLLVATGLKGNPADIPAEERILSKLRNSLTIEAGASSRDIVIAFSSRDPKLAAEVPQLIARTYMDLVLRAERESSTEDIQTLSSEIEALSARVKAAEASVAEQPDLRGPLGDTHTSMEALAELSAELNRTRASRAAAEADAERVRLALENGGSFPNVIASSLIQNLREQQAELRGHIADLSTRLSDNRPRIDVMTDQLRDLDRRIAAEADKVLRGLANIAKTARLREGQLVADIERMQAQAKGAADEEAELHTLQREAAAGREQLEAYLERYREAQTRSGSGFPPSESLTVSTPAIPEEPYFPKAAPIAAAAFAAAFLLMSIIILVRELLSHGTKLHANGAHVEPVEQVRMPAFESGTGLAVATDEGPRQSTHREQITDHGEVGVHEAAQMLIAGGAKRALFVSPQGDEAAATAVMVARDVADAGLRVLLVDLTTIGAPSAPMLDGLPLPGITDLLAGTARFTDVIHEDHYSDCHVIPIGQADQRAAMRAVGQLPMILDTLNSAYDVVIVECGSANAESIHRLVSEGTEILVSVLQPIDEIIGAREDLLSGGYEGLTLVTPANDTTAPYPDRSAA
jgi:uncharacterized protein involved in exopolysaccharide biosynthesis/Mrp family chromosome partitioning ATPase